MRSLSARLTIAGMVAALAVSLAGPASAGEPLLPKGWARGASALQELSTPPRREFGSMQANHEFSFRPRAPVPGGRVDIEGLPVVEIAPSTTPAHPPAELPAGSPGDILVINRRGKLRVSVQGFEAGFIQAGKSIPTAVGRQSEGGLVGVCGDGAGGIRPLSYEALRRVDQKGSIELVWARGYLDTAACRAVILERRTTRPAHVAGGVVFAFRTRCPACAPEEREVLHVVTPQLVDKFDKSVPFEHRKLPLMPGRSGAFEGSNHFGSPLGTWGLPDWHQVATMQCKDDRRWCAKDVRFEVSRGLGESSAVVFVGGDVGK
jgi:hypothetical protein